MEYLSLCDKQGNLLKEKGIRGEKYDDKLICLSLIFIENSKNEFLIQKTSESRGSIFATTGGHVEYGSDYKSTIIKEVSEELGYDIENDNLIEIGDFYGEYHFKKVYYLKKDIDLSELHILLDEVSYVKWMTIEEILNLIKNNQFREGNIKEFMSILAKYHKDYI